MIASVALVVALAGTEFVQAGASAVRRAVFAKNAGAVNGIKASKTPKPGRLLPLNRAGKFPASVSRAARRARPAPRDRRGRPAPVGSKARQAPPRASRTGRSRPRSSGSSRAPASRRTLSGGQRGHADRRVVEHRAVRHREPLEPTRPDEADRTYLGDLPRHGRRDPPAGLVGDPAPLDPRRRRGGVRRGGPAAARQRHRAADPVSPRSCRSTRVSTWRWSTAGRASTALPTANGRTCR